jgi:hypothetical protein
MRVKEPPQAQMNKTSYMSDEAFAALRKALDAALAFERGKRGNLKVTRIGVSHRKRIHEPR